VEHLHHVRVVDRGGKAALALEARAEHGVAGERRRDQLQRHAAVEDEVACPQHDAHAAASGDALDPVAGEDRADLRFVCR
jgi:hypothetical protein